MKGSGVDRRTFLGVGGAALGGAALAGAGLARLAGWGQGDGRGTARLLLLRLRGGNDGIGTVIPHGCPDYTPALRPTTFVAERDVLPLNGTVGFHPALAGLLPLWRAGELAIVHRAGFAEPSRSHLLERAAWDAAVPAAPPGALPWFERAWCPRHPDGGPLFAPGSELGGACVWLRSTGRVAVVDLEGFDTHEAQGGRDGAHAARLRELAEAIVAARIALSGQASRDGGLPDVWVDTTLAVVSEFGRSSGENPLGGTDHGAASVVLVAGGRVRGGLRHAAPGDWERGTLGSHRGEAPAARIDPATLFAELAAAA